MKKFVEVDEREKESSIAKAVKSAQEKSKAEK